MFDAIQEAVAQGEKVAITGFGVFEKVDRAARTGRNPSTGEPVEVKASSVPKFRPGSEFKAYVSGAKEITRGVVTSAREAAAMGARAAADAISPASQSHKPNAPEGRRPGEEGGPEGPEGDQGGRRHEGGAEGHQGCEAGLGEAVPRAACRTCRRALQGRSSALTARRSSIAA